MQPHGQYPLTVQAAPVGPGKSAKVGLVHGRTGVPVFLLYLRDTDGVRSRELYSADGLEQEIERASPVDKAAWENLMPFFLAKGTHAHVVAIPLGAKADAAALIGSDRGVRKRTGIYVLRNYTDHADLVCVPQAPVLLAEEELRTFCDALFDLVTGLEHFFVLIDLPRSFSSAKAGLWMGNMRSPDAAAYYPWLLHGDKAYPPSPFVAAGFQANDLTHGIGDLPANRDIQVDYKPIYRLTPAEMRCLGEARINSILEWRDGALRLWGGSTLADRTETDWRFISTRRTARALRTAIHELCEPFVMELATDDLIQQMNVSLQSFFQNERKLFHPDKSEPFKTDVSLTKRGTEEVVEVNLQFFIPYVVSRMSLTLAMTG